MMLKTLYLNIGDLGLPTEYTYSFLKRSRFICNFIEREVLSRIKFDSAEFNRIVIEVLSNPRDDAFVNSEKVACVELFFDRETYDGASNTGLSDYYINLIKEGIQKLDEKFPIPIAEINDGLESFTVGGMKNEWLHKKKLFRDVNLEAFLKCQLTQVAFLLRLEVKKSGNIIFDEVILETDPDENAFAYRFNDIQMVDNKIVVTSKVDIPLIEVPISEL